MARKKKPVETEITEEQLNAHMPASAGRSKVLSSYASSLLHYKCKGSENLASEEQQFHDK